MDKNSDQIIKLIKENSDGLSITQISNMINLNRNSIARYLDVLTSQGILKERIIGPAKLYYYNQEIPYSEQIELFKLAMDQANCGITIC